MKKLQQLFASVVLTLLLSVSALAGEGIIIIMKTDPPPPSSVASNDAAMVDGIILPMFTSTDPVTEVVLSLLPSVLALF
ncbi:MAG TPA: hypothetical protein VK388_16700 [Pyrinomonadaceae bacterium]|nr:hypothetical protein [Pyrinomonadaceae bacterium]